MSILIDEKTIIFGGSFNPIHNSHIDIALCAINELGLNKVLFMPTISPVHKNLAFNTSYEHRCNMIKLAIEDYKQLELFDFESKIDYKPYSYNIVKDIKAKYKLEKLYFLVGLDSLYDIETWYNYNELLKEIILVVAKRNIKYDIKIIDKINNILKPYKENIIYLDSDSSNISSSNIRNNLNKKTESNEINPKVQEYIIKNKLYE